MRPRLYGDTPSWKIGIVIPVEVLARLDRYCVEYELSRSEAIARLLDENLHDY